MFEQSFPMVEPYLVEAAEVIETPSARFRGTLQYVNIGLTKAIQDDAALEKEASKATLSTCGRG